MRLVRLAAALFVACLVIAPTAVLAHDGASGTPDVTIRILPAGVSDHAVTVPVGGLVAFVNQDGERHRMRSRTEPGEFDTGDLEPGQRYLVRFSSAGSVRYGDERTGRSAFGGTIEVRAGGGSGGSAGGGGGSTASAPATASITIGDRVFTPGTVTVKAGGTVTWTNRDDRQHTATSSGAGGISSPVLGSGQSYRKTFAQPGTFAFLCAIHPEMRGTVKVVAAGGGAGAATGGTAPTPAPTPKPKPTPTPPPASTPSSTEARIVDFSFQPAPVKITAGDTVTWRNTGEAPHTVTASDGSFESGMLQAGATFSRTFTAAGTYAFVCSFHPEMRGSVVVTATANPGAGSPPAATTAPSPTATLAPTSSPGPVAVVVPPVASPQVPETGGSSASDSTPAHPDAAPASSTSDPATTFGQLLVIGLVVSINLGAFWLFVKTVGGAMRKPV